MLYQDLSERIIGAFFDVQNALGPGLPEKNYHNSLFLKLRKNGINFVQALISNTLKYTENNANILYTHRSLEVSYLTTCMWSDSLCETAGLPDTLSR